MLAEQVGQAVPAEPEVRAEQAVQADSEEPVVQAASEALEALVD
jgi:hypothetical protein